MYFFFIFVNYFFIFRYLPLKEGNCFKNNEEVYFREEGIFYLNTSLMEFYQEYSFKVVVRKGDRIREFQQKLQVKEGDPPDLSIE